MISADGLVRRPDESVSRGSVVRKNITRLEAWHPNFERHHVSRHFRPVTPEKDFHLHGRLRDVLSVTMTNRRNQGELTSRRTRVRRVIINARSLTGFVNSRLLLAFQCSSWVRNGHLYHLNSFDVSPHFKVRRLAISRNLRLINSLPVENNVFARRSNRANRRNMVRVVVDDENVDIVNHELPMRPVSWARNRMAAILLFYFRVVRVTRRHEVRILSATYLAVVVVRDV